MRAKVAGGTGGMIPFKHVPALLDAAKDKGVKLSTDDFLPRTDTPTQAQEAAE